jgi:predicted O-linked N-acetylglucosamine transferase (SPINDLY family)
MEALWMGVPVLTLKGDRYLSRSTESFNINLGLENWIAVDENDYVKKAKEFALNFNYLKSLKTNLRERVLASPLFDGKKFSNNFAMALLEMWSIYKKSKIVEAK